MMIVINGVFIGADNKGYCAKAPVNVLMVARLAGVQRVLKLPHTWRSSLPRPAALGEKRDV